MIAEKRKLFFSFLFFLKAEVYLGQHTMMYIFIYNG